MTNADLYRQHLAALDTWLADALQRAAAKGVAADAVLFHAGRAAAYYADDQEIVFHPTPHFVRWVPLEGPEHCVLARPGKKPLVVRVAPRDFWYELAPAPASWWQGEVELHEVPSFGDVAAVTGPLGRVAYVGGAPEAASELGIPAALVNPEALVKPLDWHRATKTAHEIELTLVAARRAAEGHRVARKAFESGASEREIHWAYLQGTGHLEKELPFETIVAYDEKTATLHYQGKRTSIPTGRHTFMLDAGAACDGYASDITRTWVRANDPDPVFRELLLGLDALERDLVAMVTPGRPYPEIHFAAHRKVAELLCRVGLVKAGPEQAFDQGVTRTFLPHGVGHHLGIQVHDIGGRQAGPDGGVNPPPAGHPFLRNTRVLEPGHLVTIEPGIYFIPMLMDELEAAPAGRLVDWTLARRLVACGGIRIEDDVLCTAAGPRDLTRDLIQGPRGE